MNEVKYIDMSTDDLNKISFECGQKILKLNREQKELDNRINLNLFDIILFDIEYAKFLLVTRIIEDTKSATKLLRLIKNCQLELNRQHEMLDGIIKLNASSIQKRIELHLLVKNHMDMIKKNINLLRHLLHNYMITQKIRDVKRDRAIMERAKKVQINELGDVKISDMFKECKGTLDYIKKAGSIKISDLLK